MQVSARTAYRSAARQATLLRNSNAAEVAKRFR
jgi:hypothetical protein